jgi:hypothetical protein
MPYGLHIKIHIRDHHFVAVLQQLSNTVLATADGCLRPLPFQPSFLWLDHGRVYLLGLVILVTESGVLRVRVGGPW